MLVLREEVPLWADQFIVVHGPYDRAARCIDGVEDGRGDVPMDMLKMGNVWLRLFDQGFAGARCFPGPE